MRAEEGHRPGGDLEFRSFRKRVIFELGLVGFVEVLGRETERRVLLEEKSTRARTDRAVRAGWRRAASAAGRQGIWILELRLAEGLQVGSETKMNRSECEQLYPILRSLDFSLKTGRG